MRKEVQIDLPFGKIKNMRVRHRYPANVGGESMTDKSHKQACDVNHIIANFQRTGVLPQPKAAAAQYGDVSKLSGDLLELQQHAQEVLHKTQEFLDDREAKRQEKVKEENKKAEEAAKLQNQIFNRRQSDNSRQRRRSTDSQN